MSRLVEIVEDHAAGIERGLFADYIKRNGSYAFYVKYGAEGMKALKALSPPPVAATLQRILDSLARLPQGVDAGTDAALQKQFLNLDAWL